VYGVKTDREFVNTLTDDIHEQGDMDKLISDSSKSETSGRVKDILRALVIADWKSEPYHQNPNFAENRYATIKSWTNRILNRSGAPDPHGYWLCHMYDSFSTVWLLVLWVGSRLYQHWMA
jgi:hypothetical protein